MNNPELQTLAQEVPYTEGRWWVVTRPGSAEESRVMSTSGTIALCDGRVLLGEKERAAFIAACDPQTVLALIDAVEAARNYLDGHDRRGDKLRDALAEIEVAA